MSAVCPVYPEQQTFPDPVGTSHLCHERTLKHEGDMRRPIMERLQIMYDETATL